MSCALRALAHQRQRILDGRRQVERRALELHPAGLDLRQVEDVVDQREQVPAGRVDVLQVVVLLVVEVAEQALEQHLGEADDRVERRAQLVRHVGEEFGLVLVGDLELAALVLDLVEQPRVLDRDHGLVGEGPQQRDVLVGEGAGVFARHPDRADGAAFPHHRRADRGLDAERCRTRRAPSSARVVEVG